MKSRKLPNRSQAVRFLLRQHLVDEKWDRNDKVSGCVVLVYDHHRRDLLSKLVATQHDYQELILSNQHVHLDHHHCLETISLKGRAGELRELADRLIAIKGVSSGKLVTTAF